MSSDSGGSTDPKDGGKEQLERAFLEDGSRALKEGQRAWSSSRRRLLWGRRDGGKA